jgi:hypothetical protein
MTRKILVSVIALIYMILGFMTFCNSWGISSSGALILRWLALVGGALATYAGFAMFRLNEFGRKLVVLLLSIRVVINILLILRVLQNGPGLGIDDRFGEIVYRIDSPFVFQGFLLLWSLIAVLMIIFLSQNKTRAIFAPEARHEQEPDIVLE